MQTEKNSTTYVIGRCDGLVPQLRELTKWLAKDASDRSAEARVVFLGGVVYGPRTKAVVDEVQRVLKVFPGSTIISGGRERGLLDFLEGGLNRAPTMWWMAHGGGRAVVDSFGVDATVRGSREIRRIVARKSPALLPMLRAGKVYEIDGDFCITQGWSFPPLPRVDEEEIDLTGWNVDEINAWHKAMNKIVVYERAPTNDCYPEVGDTDITLGGFPDQTGRVHLLAIDNGEASRFVFASRADKYAAVSVAVRPAEMFRRAPLEDPAVIRSRN